MKTQSGNTIQTIEQVAKMLLKDYTELQSWDAVGERYGLTKPLVWRVALKGYEPTKPHIRLALGLPAMKPAPVCVHCGEVHVSSRCPSKPPSRRSSSGATVGVLHGKEYQKYEVVNVRRNMYNDGRPLAPVLVVVKEA